VAIFQNDPFPGTDYTQYASWPKVTTPDGRTFYEVPNYPGYVFDPVASNASGRKVFHANPKLSIEKEQEKEAILKQAAEQQNFNSSLPGQLIPVAAGTAGTIAAAEALRPGPSLVDQALAAKISGTPFPSVPGVTPSASGAAQAAAQGATGAPATPNVIGAARVNGAVPVGTAPGGGTMMSDGSIVTDQLPPNSEVAADGSIFNSETGQMIGRVAQGALGAYQIYQGIGDFKDDKIGGVLGVGSGAANVGAALGSETAADFAAPLMAAKGAYDMYGAFQRGGEGIRTSGTELGAGIGTMILPGVGTLIGAGAGNLLGYGLDKLGLFHKTTRQVAQEHTGDLLKASDDPRYQTYVQGMREQYNAAPPDPSKPFHGGQYGSFDEYKAAGLDPNDLTGVYGNLKTFGPEWANLTQEQRVAVTKGLIDAGLYESNKGEVEITDPAKALEIKNNVLTGFNVGASTTAQAAAQGATQKPPVNPANVINAVQQSARSQTRSPGIGLNGKPIFYNG